MKRILTLVLAGCILLLCACSPNVEETQPPETSAPATQVQETEKETQEETQAATKPIVRYRNPLTGEPMDEKMTARPYTVMLNNYEAAMPLHGAAEADILFEALTEGGMTRCMGIYSDLSAVETLGSIRSARRHFVSISAAYDAIFVHYGKSEHPLYGALDYMNQLGWDHMDGTIYDSYFYENDYRHQNGWPSDACHFLVGQRAVEYATDKGFTQVRDEALDFGLKFDDDKVIVGDSANKLTVWFNQGGTPGKWNKYTTLNYDKATKQYLSFQYGKDNIDGNTGKTLAFRNVLVLRAKTSSTDVNLVYVELEGEGTGYYACNGQLVPIKWSRASTYDPFTYTLEDGTPLTLGVGKSYVAIVPTNATVTYE